MKTPVAFLFALMAIFGGVASCFKKEAPPAGSVAEKPTTPAPAAALTPVIPLEDRTPFVIPPSAKKQIKYFPEGSPTRAIQDLDDMLDSYIIDPKTSEDRQYNERLKRTVIHGTFDVHELSQAALAEHWKDRTPKEQDYFVDLITRLLERKAIYSKEQCQKKKKTRTVYQVTYTGHKFIAADESKALTLSNVHIPSQALTIDLKYKLKKTPAGWMIYDVIVDGASLLDNYKYQFDKIIDEKGYPNLIHRMESKLKNLQAKNTKEALTPQAQ